MATAGKQVMVRKVYQHNLLEEFFIIGQCLSTYPYVAVDTEFPGTVIHSKKPYYELSPEENYELMRQNVNSLKLIQLGLTLSDSEGNLPDLGSDTSFIWEFNFREFNEEEDLHNPDSVKLLKTHGIDFVKNSIEGIKFGEFGNLFMESGLGISVRSFFGQKRASDPLKLTWIFFHSTYDIGYLIKVLNQKDLPANHATFMALVKIYLGTSIFDVKEMVKPFGWQFSLEKVAKNLGVHRVVGQGHQAGSDSLITMQSFMKLKLNYFQDQQALMHKMFNNKLHGLEIKHSLVVKQLVLIKSKYFPPAPRLNHPMVNYQCGGPTGVAMFPPQMIGFHPVVAVQPVYSYLF